MRERCAIPHDAPRLSRLIEDRLIALGWSHGALARALKVSATYVSRLIAGDTLLSFDRVIEVSALLDIDPVDLLCARMEQAPAIRIPVPADDLLRRDLANAAVLAGRR